LSLHLGCSLLGSGEFLDGEVGGIAYDYEVGAAIFLAGLLDCVGLLPVRVVALGLYLIEMKGESKGV